MKQIIPYIKKPFLSRFILIILVGSSLPSCILTAPQKGVDIPKPLREKKIIKTNSNDFQQIGGNRDTASDKDKKIRFQATPTTPKQKRIVDFNVEEIKPSLSHSQPVSINVENIPLPSFINEVFGNLLKLSFEIAPALQKSKDLVTLRVVEPQKPIELYNIAKKVLVNYGVDIEIEEKLLRFVVGNKNASKTPPLLISGRALPNVPLSHRPIFQFVPLTAVRNTMVAGTLRGLYGGSKLNISEDPNRNAILLKGTSNLVNQAIEAIKFLDQPYMRGRHSVRINPVFLSASELAKQLNQVLRTEGYASSIGATLGSIILLPMDTINSVIVFSVDKKILDHALQWARTIDTPGHLNNTNNKSGVYFYAVENTQAENIATVLSPLLQNQQRQQQRQLPRQDRPVIPNTQTLSNLVVDKVRNALIYQGEGEKWASLLPVIKKMDQPAKLVLVEVTVAQITLTDNEKFGIEWILQNVGIGDLTGTLNTGFDIAKQAGSGLTYRLNSAGQTRALLNAYAKNQRVSVLSSPRLMVKSGETASINVGSQVPIVTSQSSDPNTQQDGTSAILQQIQYRNTGVILEVKPTVHAESRVDLEVSQEISSVGSADASITPTINNRKVETSLSLSDGGSILIGGLISTSVDKSNTGIPVLKDVPVVGHLFRSDSVTKDRNELIIMITPYIISTDTEAEAITENFRQMLHIEDLPENLSQQKSINDTSINSGSEGIKE